MQSVPLLPKAEQLPNLDAAPLIRELFQEEFSALIPSKKLSKNLLTSLYYERVSPEERSKDYDTFKNCDFTQNLRKPRDSLIGFAENVFEAYNKHENVLKDIREAEKNIFEAYVSYLEREATVLNDEAIQDFLSLKRHPLLHSLNTNYIKKFKLLQGDSGLPPRYEAKSDFRIKNFKKWRKLLKTFSEDDLFSNFLKTPEPTCQLSNVCKKLSVPSEPTKKCAKFRPKKSKVEEKEIEILRAEPKIVFFSNYKVGDIYVADIRLKNVYTRGIRFYLKPMNPDGPFKLTLNEKNTTKIYPGLSVSLTTEFTPRSLDNVAEDICIVIEDGHMFTIPLVAYLEPPLLKTHLEIDEFKNTIPEKIASSYLECGPCFSGDTKVTKVRFHCCRGSGEFFIMSSENWSRSHVNAVTHDNILEIPPFRIYPVFFKIEKNEVIDLFVEFLPKNSGTHVENIVIACDNGEIRSLDLLADAVGWHSYFFTFEDSLLKELPVNQEDDSKVKYYLDFEDTLPNGKVEKTFYISNNSNMPFEFQWKIRDPNIPNSQEKYLKLSKYQVKIDPESGTFEPSSIYEFLVSITFNDAEIGNYKMVLSMYVINLPYQCIEEDNTVIQPTGFVRNLYSQSLYGEDENTTLSPELLSLQGTYESLQESIKSYVECLNKVHAVPKNDFCRTTCIPNPGLCAKPLKKSKTFFNIGDNIDDDGLTCACRMKAMEGESASDSCTSNPKEKVNDSPILKNEIMWDFVDVLVDEIEIWVEVTPTRVTLNPTIIELIDPLKLNDSPVFHQIRITNHNQPPIICKWLKPSHEKITSATSEDKPFSLLFDRRPEDMYKEESTHIEKESSESENSVNQKDTNKNKKMCIVTVEPQEEFVVPGLSEFACNVGTIACQPGRIEQKLWLTINNDDLKLSAIVIGTAITENITVDPKILDFGVVKQGNRYKKNYNVTNESSFPVMSQVSLFKFDFKEEKFFTETDLNDSEELKGKRKFLKLKESSSEIDSYYLDARTPGYTCSLMEIKSMLPQTKIWKSQYILVLGESRPPILSLSAPRFENAILAPPGMMYIGQKISTKVILTNDGSVETFFTWGHAFGCHCRKIQVEISPKRSRVEKKKKLTIEIDITPLDEGIISHCYIPCFFLRNEEPLILSIVGIVQNLNVTFEIIDYPNQSHADPATFLKSPFYHTVLRVPWPIKVYNPTLDKKFICEEDVLNMKCQCSEVEEEANRAFGPPKQETDRINSERSATRSEDTIDESSKKSKSFYPGASSSSKAIEENSKEDFKESVSSDAFSLDKRSLEENSVQKYKSRESSIDTLQFVKSQIEFLKVPYETPTTRQFVIRNETAIPTTFSIDVFKFGPQPQTTNRVKAIKYQVLQGSKEEFSKQKQPLVLIVEPSQGDLLGFDAVCINVTACGNTWGEYRDNLICRIKGIEPFYLKVFVQIVGHPIFFPMFSSQTSNKSILRFEPLKYTSDPVTKKIKVVNRSAIPLNVSWIVFLIEPLFKEEEREESYNLCADSKANVDSTHSREESSLSTKVYLPKNASESVSTFRNMMEMKDFSRNSGTFEWLSKTDSTSEKKEIQECGEEEKSWTVHTVSEEMKSDVQLCSFRGRIDNVFFQVDPKEMDFNPFEGKLISITFNPQICKPPTIQEYKAVLTGCVKLEPQYEKCPGIFFRPCGVNFVSDVLDFNAIVETPLVSFEIFKGDLKFVVDANAVLKSPSKNLKISKKYLISNNNLKAVILKIEIVPGVIFHVKSINTIDKFYRNHKPEVHEMKIEPKQLLEMILECSVTYKDVLYGYELLKLRRKKDEGFSEELKAGQSKRSNNEKCKEKSESEPWSQYFNDVAVRYPERHTEKCNLSHKDSLELNLNRMSSKSDNSICNDLATGRGYFAEVEGEDLELVFSEEFPSKPKKPKHVVVIEEEINFVQTGLVTQTLQAELHLSFPAIKITPKCLDFGVVYVNDTAVRFLSLVNLVGFSTDFTIKVKGNVGEFVVRPLTGNLPATNYNSDIGKTITVEFRPSQTGHFKEILQIFCNTEMEFDCYEVYVSGFGTWNEKYKSPKVEIYTKFQEIYPHMHRI